MGGMEGWLQGAPSVKFAGGCSPRVGTPRGMGEGPLPVGPPGLLGGVPHPPWRVLCGDRPGPMDPPPSLPPLAARSALGG